MFLHIMKWWCYSAGNSKETKYTVGQRSTVFSHSVILISVSAQHLENERMEFDKKLHMHWHLHDLSWDCSILVINSWWPWGRFDSHFREIWVLHQGGWDGTFKTSFLQFRGYQNNQTVIDRRLRTVASRIVHLVLLILYTSDFSSYPMNS